jgi:hypothetical protein
LFVEPQSFIDSEHTVAQSWHTRANWKADNRGRCHYQNAKRYRGIVASGRRTRLQPNPDESIQR